MSDTPRTDKAFAYYRDGQHLVEADFARQLERENASLRNLLHEIQENTWVSIKTCARIDAALNAARKEQP